MDKKDMKIIGAAIEVIRSRMEKLIEENEKLRVCINKLKEKERDEQKDTNTLQLENSDDNNK